MFIDLGSTHNFIDSRVTKKVDSDIYPSIAFEIMVTNEGKMACHG